MGGCEDVRFAIGTLNAVEKEIAKNKMEAAYQTFVKDCESDIFKDTVAQSLSKAKEDDLFAGGARSDGQLVHEVKNTRVRNLFRPETACVIGLETQSQSELDDAAVSKQETDRLEHDEELRSQVDNLYMNMFGGP